MRTIELTTAPIDVNEVLRSIASPHAGGEVLFLGTVRQWTKPVQTPMDNSTDSDSEYLAAPQKDGSCAGVSQPPGVETAWLVYEAYEEMALKQLHRLADRAFKRWPICGLAIVHRLGRVEVLDPCIAIAVSCPHRPQAFEAARWLIDTIKCDVPIWKQENDASGSGNWIHPN
jgi:molybdopterin synthase catalytic subunit